MSRNSTLPIPYFRCIDGRFADGAILCAPTEETKLPLNNFGFAEISTDIQLSGLSKYKPYFDPLKMRSSLQVRLTSLQTTLWMGCVRAAFVNEEPSIPILEPAELEVLLRDLGLSRMQSGISVSPSLIRPKGIERRSTLRHMSAGLLVWLESSASDENE